MEARRDPRGFIFFIILLLILNSPEPQQAGYSTRPAFERLLQREYTELGVLNSTRYGDFDAKDGRWLNTTGLRAEDGFAWDLLEPVKRRAREASERVLGDSWRGVIDGGNVVEEQEGRVPVYRNMSGFVQGVWTRLPLSRVRHPQDMGNSSVVPDNPFGTLPEYDRNITGTSGSMRLHIIEVDGKMRVDANKTASEISAKVILEDDGSFAGNWWEFMIHGVHFLKSGTAVLTTTSDRYAGIFALPHMQFSEHMYEVSQRFLNRTIHETIEKQKDRQYMQWNPWTSSVAGVNDGQYQGHHCEFVLFLQENPSQLNIDLNWLEHEMRYPSGARIPLHTAYSMSMVGFSPDCGFVIESKGPPDFPPSEAVHLIGSKTEEFNDRTLHSVLAFAIAFAYQLSLFMKQMKETATPSMRSRVSFYTIAMMALGDGFGFLVLIFMYLFLGTAQLSLYMVAFFALFSVIAHLRFLMDIWSVQVAERERRNRQEAATNPPITITTPASTQPSDTLPLPVTAARPRPPTPVIVAPDQDDPSEDPAATATTLTPTMTNPRAEFGSLYVRFCLTLLGIFFITIHFTTARNLYRAIFFDSLSFIYLSFWVPQIYRNVMRNCRKALRWDYVVGTSIARAVPLAYFYLKEDNVLFSKTDWTAFAILAGWLWIQIVALASQDVLGPRFFIKKDWAPPAYDYHPILREDQEGATMPLNVTSATSPTADSPTSSPTPAQLKTPGESKSHDKRNRTFDCSICAQDIEVPVLASGSSDEGVGVGGTSMILQRRMYMVTPCRHVFHTGCLEGWMRYRLVCPNCREALPPL